MALQAPKGTRDFYPEDMARLNAIFDAWRRVSLRNGFEEFDGPAFETLELYTAKSGDEIVSQLFHMTDRAGRELALRPELTPSLARMVNQRASALSLPIKWYSIPRLWRGETPQAGRLREFFQWNIDVVGSAETVADAECIYVAIDLLRELGLGSQDVVVRISSRPLLAEILKERGVAEAELNRVYSVIDKQSKVPPQKFNAMLVDSLAQSGVDNPAPVADELTAVLTGDDLAGLPIQTEAADAEKARLSELFALLDNFGVADYCRFDLGIVRGLAYYTGPVFEVYDRAASMRAVAGGGRYDSLLEVLGGPKMPAVGFGMGDVVLANLLESLGKTPSAGRRTDYFLIDAEPSYFPRLLRLADELRRRNRCVQFSYRRAGVSKQFKQASQSGAARVVILGGELEQGNVSVKDLATGEQQVVPYDSLLS